MNFFSVPSCDPKPSMKSFESYDTNDDNMNRENRQSASLGGRFDGHRDDPEVFIEINLKGPEVSASQPTRLFSYIAKRNWDAALKRCKGVESKEALTWVTQKNRDGTIQWKQLPIHQV